jgi:large subunit ribosomal protein L4
VKRLARKSALSYMAKDKNIIVLEDFSFDAPKTKSFIDFLNNFDQLDNKTLLVLAESNKNIFLSSRNLSKAKVVLASELNTYDVMRANKLMVMESSINEIEKNF